MMRILIKLFFISSLFFVLISCNKEEKVGLYSIYQLDKYKQEKPVIELDTTVWKLQKGWMATFPKGIEAYKNTAQVNGKNTNMVIVVFNPKMNIELKPVLSATAKTPTNFYKDEVGDVYACLNAGFFFGSTSLSLVMYNSVINSTNVKSLSRVLNGTSTPYYPTRAAFGLNASRTPTVSWVYNVGAGNGVLYSYPQPSPNVEGQTPQAVPTEVFPLGATLWQQSTAIGGSPMLVKDSVINLTDVNEMIAVDNTSSRARSAIGYLKNGNVVLFAAEGGNATTAPGLTLREVANQMLGLGCIGAINLDGGGSTSMIVDGVQTVNPSSGGVERAVISALIVKKR